MQTQPHFSRDISIDFHGFELLEHSSPALKGEHHTERNTYILLLMHPGWQSIPSHQVPLKDESRFHAFSFWFFFLKDVCIDFYQCQCHSARNTRNDNNLILFVFLFNVSWALTEKRWRKDYQALSTNKVNCFIEIKLSKTLWQSKVTKKIHE